MLGERLLALTPSVIIRSICENHNGLVATVNQGLNKGQTLWSSSPQQDSPKGALSGFTQQRCVFSLPLLRVGISITLEWQDTQYVLKLWNTWKEKMNHVYFQLYLWRKIYFFNYFHLDFRLFRLINLTLLFILYFFFFSGSHLSPPVFMFKMTH